MIGIVDYGIGNIGSIANMLKKIGCLDVKLLHKSDEFHSVDKYILPGVGSFDAGMKLLNQSGMRRELDLQVLQNKKPILGICLGMQMLGRGSEEGCIPGLGYIPFECVKFNFDDNSLKVPHMGWDYAEIAKRSPIAVNPKDMLRFYFVHAYYAVCDNHEDILMKCQYGINFAAAVNKDNIYGVQFHPEKSHGFGKWLLKNFVEEV
ncbi:imidazole glycerol phosphate synthase subunit HisH [Anaerovibrio lipolyticus]|uniref:imidazole glycerol phosphate synthase subunit HisH n=1 Tax=Anaerovibrio lipolyticus TaxID=82374 RepID=UPI000484BE00|nr:imidazole glycerol phosphate synthase subunit HisH [Anaerovibrio lipolyticus]